MNPPWSDGRDGRTVTPPRPHPRPVSQSVLRTCCCCRSLDASLLPFCPPPVKKDYDDTHASDANPRHATPSRDTISHATPLHNTLDYSTAQYARLLHTTAHHIPRHARPVSPPMIFCVCHCKNLIIELPVPFLAPFSTWILTLLPMHLISLRMLFP